MQGMLATEAQKTGKETNDTFVFQATPSPHDPNPEAKFPRGYASVDSIEKMKMFWDRLMTGYMNPKGLQFAFRWNAIAYDEEKRIVMVNVTMGYKPLTGEEAKAEEVTTCSSI